jgi:UDP-glucose 4-epimerase
MQPGQEIANLGSGSGFSVKQVLDTATAVVGETIPHVYGPRREGDPPALIASNDRANELLGWEPQRGTLQEMIGSAWQLLEKSRAG